MKRDSMTGFKRERIVQPGVFTDPSGAKLWSAINEDSAAKLWSEIGTFTAYPKPDGWRFQAHKIGETVKIFSRGKIDWSNKFPRVIDLLSSRLAVDQAILDIELVGFDGYGRHLEAAKLRNAEDYQCIVLDALRLGDENITSFPTSERLSIIQDRLKGYLRDRFSLAEYRRISSENEWRLFYQMCLARMKDGFDGAIVKLLDKPYFTPVIKVKPEEQVDAVVVGAYRGKKDNDRKLMSLLLAVPDQKRNLWIPIGRVNRNSSGWDAIWKACEPFISSHRPVDLESPPEEPDLWVSPKIVVSAMIRWPSKSSSYSSGVKFEAVNECKLRVDKSADDATSFEQVLQLVGIKRNESQQSLFDFIGNPH
jgi:DNA ligase-1